MKKILVRGLFVRAVDVGNVQRESGQAFTATREGGEVVMLATVNAGTAKRLTKANVVVEHVRPAAE
jgi:hypothetical protein